MPVAYPESNANLLTAGAGLGALGGNAGDVASVGAVGGVSIYRDIE